MQSRTASIESELLCVQLTREALAKRSLVARRRLAVSHVSGSNIVGKACCCRRTRLAAAYVSQSVLRSRPKDSSTREYLALTCSRERIGDKSAHEAWLRRRHQHSQTWRTMLDVPAAAAAARRAATHRRRNRKAVLPPRRSRRQPQARQGQPQALQGRRPQSRRRRPPRPHRSRTRPPRRPQLSRPAPNFSSASSKPAAASGKAKGKYKQPIAPSVDGALPPLPEGWAWASVDQLLAIVTDGDHQPPPQTDVGVPFLVIGNVRKGEIDFSSTRFVGADYFESVDNSRRPKNGDLLYTLVGSYGILVPVRTDRTFCIQRHIAILRPHRGSPIEYLALAMASNFVFNQATACATGTAQPTVPLTGLRALAIPLPPAAEQQRIVREAESRLSTGDAVADEVEASLRRAEGLRQATLSGSFRDA